MEKGLFVVLEGIDGAGGEVQSKLLFEYLKSQGKDVIKLVYPDYSGPIGKFIHDYLHKKHEFSNEILFLLHSADRLKDKGRIKSWLEEGKTVIADRYFTSTLAYQCTDEQKLDAALKFADAFEIQKPDIIIYLNVSPETSIERKFKEKNSLDRNEENKALLEKVSKSYENLIEKQVFAKWVVVDGEKSKEEVFSEIKNILKV